jgi:cysteine desulfurase
LKFFDYAATTPLDLEAAETYVKAATEYYGNTSSLHDIGTTAKDLLENCRQEFARMLHVESAGIYFTSGGSESNFLGIQALLSSRKKEGSAHIISSMAEHASIRSTLETLSQQGYEITLLPFNKEGRIDINLLKEATKDDTVLIAIQHGNSEIGSLQPIEEIGKWCQERKILLHCDCVHTFGKLDLQNITALVDSLSLSSHKFYGPKGVGVAYVNPKLAWKPYYPGTTHEKSFRPGTINVPAIAAMTVAAQNILQNQKEEYTRISQLRQLFISTLNEVGDHITLYNCGDDQQIPHTLAMRIHGMEGQWIMLECNRRGFAISTGSACSVGQTSPSKTMVAMNIPDKTAKEMIRISFGRHTSEQDVAELGKVLVQIVHSAS